VIALQVLACVPGIISRLDEGFNMVDQPQLGGPMEWFGWNDDSQDTDYPPTGYELLKRPAKPGKPVNVWTYIRLDHLYDISEDSSTIHFHLTVRLKWNDTRLRFAPNPQNAESKNRIVKADSIWHPSLRVLKDMSHRNPLESAKVSYLGEVTYTAHYDAKVWTEIDFSHYPFDSHKIVVDVSSYRYSADRVILNMTNFDPNMVNLEALSGPMWRVVQFNQKSVPNKRTVYLDNDSVVEIELYVRRRVINPLVVMILPMGLLGILSTTPLFISIEKFSDRVTIASTGCFTILLFHNIVNEYFPKMGYLTWLHYYTIFTNVYIFGAFFAVMALQVLHRSEGGKTVPGRREQVNNCLARASHSTPAQTPLIHSRPGAGRSASGDFGAIKKIGELKRQSEAKNFYYLPRSPSWQVVTPFACGERRPFARCCNNFMAIGFCIGYAFFNVFMFALEYENW